MTSARTNLTLGSNAPETPQGADVPGTIAWFSPVPPTRSGIATYTAEVVPLICHHFTVDLYPADTAHDFVWRQRRHPYGLVVYQMGNARCHDYMWGYLARYPGLVVLHDARLHQSRARRLLEQGRADDYRRELLYDRPDSRPDFAEYAAAGLGGSIYYFWPMLRAIVRTARLVAVHSERLAAETRDEFPGAAVETIRMGVPAALSVPGDRAPVRRELGVPQDAVVFAALGKVTAEKRITTIVKAFERIVDEGLDAYLLLVGDASEYEGRGEQLAPKDLAPRIRVAGHVADSELGSYLSAADVCLCLRWPTGRELSAAWLRCLAAGKPTIISDLAHMVDVPDSAALRVGLLDEDRSLVDAMRYLATDGQAREALARGGHAYWSTHHTLEAMAADYRRVLAIAAARNGTPWRDELPRHFQEDYSTRTEMTLRRFGLRMPV